MENNIHDREKSVCYVSNYEHCTEWDGRETQDIFETESIARDSNRFAKFNFSIKMFDSITSFDLNESELNNSIEIIIVSGKAKRSSSLRSLSVAGG